MDLTDDVVARAGAGDESAFSALYLDVQPRLRRYAAALVGRHADDVTAEAWRHIARDIRTFHGDLGDFRAWTARIVRTRALEDLRHQPRRPEQGASAATRRDSETRDHTESAVSGSIPAAAAIELIASLPREQAEARSCCGR